MNLILCNIAEENEEKAMQYLQQIGIEKAIKNTLECVGHTEQYLALDLHNQEYIQCAALRLLYKISCVKFFLFLFFLIKVKVY